MRPGSWLLLMLGVACAAPTPGLNTTARLTIPRGLDRYRPVPENNPLTSAKVALGRALFFDSLLSKDRSLACATCHDPTRAFTDGRHVSIGVYGRRGRRNVPTLVNRAYGKLFFWDGRMSTLEEQVLMPIQDSLEMGMTLDEVVQRVDDNPEYRALFHKVFGRDPTAENLASALASYVRTILSGGTPFDQYAHGDTAALPSQVRRGLAVFRGKGCVVCHVGPNFTDELFHNTGIAWQDGGLADSGRYVVSRRPGDQGAFKTPTLREVARTAPYMHDGSLETLADVIAFYNSGGHLNPFLDPVIHPLNLTQDERHALLAFLESLSGRVLEGVIR